MNQFSLLSIKRALVLAVLLSACGSDGSQPESVKTAVIKYWVLSPDAPATVHYITTEGIEGQTTIEGEWRFSVERPQSSEVYVKAFCKNGDDRCRLKAAIGQDGYPSSGTEATSDPGRPVAVEQRTIVR